MVLGAIAEHSLPLTMAPVLVELAQNLATDKVALSGMKLSRTAATYKMVYGLGRTFSERTFTNIRKWAFSINVDESTSNSNKKVLSMLVSYYHEDLEKVVVEHLGSAEVMKVSAANLERVSCQFFQDNNIPWSNMMMDLYMYIHGHPCLQPTEIYLPTLVFCL